MLTAPHASLAVGIPKLGVKGHSMVAATGTEVNTGAVLSSTVITCEAVAVLPQASVAINVLVRVYSLAQVPGAEASVEVMLTAPHASLAVGIPKLGVKGHSMVAAAGTEVNTCLLYTSDAADERSSVDLGGRRIIKKKIVCAGTHESTANQNNTCTKLT